MAEPQRTAPSHGLLHVRVRHTKNFTILPNQVIQHTGSAVTAGIAAYLFSQRDGTLVSIERLCAHFQEGRTRISRALTELETTGYLERRTERAPNGTIRTRLILHHQPHTASPKRSQGPQRRRVTTTHQPVRRPAVRTVPTPRPRPATAMAPAPTSPSAPAPAPEAATVRTPGRAMTTMAPAPGPTPITSGPPCTAPAISGPAPGESAATPPASTETLRLLTTLGSRDPRLCLSQQEVTLLAPDVDAWVARGATTAAIGRALTGGLPAEFTGRPFHLLRYRLRTFLPPTPLTLPPTHQPTSPPAVAPLRMCAGCHNVAIRSTQPAYCRDCRSG